MSAKSKARRAFARNQERQNALNGLHLERQIAAQSGVSKQSFNFLKEVEATVAPSAKAKAGAKKFVDGPVDVSSRSIYYLCRDLKLNRDSVAFLLKSEVSQILDAIWDKEVNSATKSARKDAAQVALLERGATLYNSATAPVSQTATTPTQQKSVIQEIAPEVEEVSAPSAPKSRTSKNALLAQAMSLLAEGKIDGQQYDHMVGLIGK